MRKTETGYVHSPSDLTRFMESPFASFMDRLFMEFPDLVTPDETDEQAELIIRKGHEHEAAFLESLNADGRDVCRIEQRKGAFDKTRQAVADHREIIYQAALRRADFAGFADFLVLDPLSGLYEVWDTKLARKPRPYFLVQLCAYADMLEQLQGARPEHIRVVLGSNDIRAFRTEDSFYYYRRLRKAYLDQFAAFDPDNPPIPRPDADHGRWASHAEKWFEERDHLCRVANIRQSQIKKLGGAGIQTLTDLATTSVERVPRLDDSVFATLKDQAALQSASAGRENPEYRLLPFEPEDPERGLARLPGPSPLDVFFDIEGYPLVDGGLEYLWGASYRDGDEIRFQDWWAFDREMEKAAFESFIDWVIERRRRDPGMHVYHYASYEVTAVRKLMGRYATREEEVDDLLRGGVFVDLYRIVSEGIRIGEPAYSIKNVEHLYIGRRDGEVTDAGASIVAFEKWLEAGDSRNWRESAILESIRNYNEADCESTVLLVDWLRARCEEAGITWCGARPDGDDEALKKPLPDEVVARKHLASRLLDEIPESAADRSADEERWRVQELLAHLVEFHRREEKPVWWAMFDRCAMTPDELWDDVHCLGKLERDASAPVQIKHSRGFWYTFDPEQDTKISAGDRVMLAQDISIKPQVEEMKDEGRILLKFGPSALRGISSGEPPASLSLIPQEHVSADVIVRAIQNVVEEYGASRCLSPCLESFLFRSLPRVKGGGRSVLVDPEGDVVDQAVEVVSNLEDSAICIQGPPGAGKTFTGSRVVTELLDRGRSIGVTSNSHKAIHNLLRAVGKRRGGLGDCIKVGEKDLGDLCEEFPDLQCMTSEAAEGLFSSGLIGGTAWFFSRDGMKDRLDYLFVDEAGQVSVANLVAMSRATRNLVLLGDQMQLGQPTKGSHPGESGQSALKYLLKDHATIPEDLGIFLPTTFRLHPEICESISGAVYEDRLKPEQRTADRVILLAPGESRLARRAGIAFLPVEHEGNSQGSDEEVDEIVALSLELLARDWTPDPGVTRQLTLDDILFVAPYNMQVRRLQQRLPDGARVGTVDRFQGQEAAVVVISMCTSAGESGPRGLEFLLDRNRLNVAISRAQCLAVVVGDPRLALTPCSTVEALERMNLYCRVIDVGMADRA